jgi:hypothetical protein
LSAMPSISMVSTTASTATLQNQFPSGSGGLLNVRKICHIF